MYFRSSAVSVVLVSILSLLAADTLRFQPDKSAELNPLVSLLTTQCSDPKYTCADNTTCCEKESGGYGCCPYNKVDAFTMIYVVFITYVIFIS